MQKAKLKKQDGEFTFGIPRLKKILHQLPSGEWLVEIKEFKHDRTLRQNRLYWEWITIIGEELGYFKNEMHETFLDAFAPVQTFRDLNGKPKQKPVRSSQMTVQQMSEYMRQIDHFAAEQGINLPRPEDEIL